MESERANPITTDGELNECGCTTKMLRRGPTVTIEVHRCDTHEHAIELREALVALTKAIDSWQGVALSPAVAAALMHAENVLDGVVVVAAPVEDAK